MDEIDTGTPDVIGGRGVQSGLAFANFELHKFSYLNITSLGTDYVLDGEECGFACVSLPSCFSYNLAAFYDINGRISCELLPSDKYNNTDKFVSIQSFHHFSIVSPCMSGPCQNGGSCLSIYEKNSYLCLCVKGFTGSTCQTDIDDCASHPCKNNGICTDRVNGFNCSCAPGFDGTQCETNVDDCASHPCKNNGTCADRVNGFNCSCAPGFNGTQCETSKY
ncbi:fibropellin-3-like [Orbicella faveolata]|uniref:fibropellin-3-like n=1 Tax=Orbicella faveolata TaxID=48498 RepID=UPI0009E47EB8|nr:fibropellin-3-like [Orbicella faveolata]